MSTQEDDQEFSAIRVIYTALKDLDTDARTRVLDYVSQRLSLNRVVGEFGREANPSTSNAPKNDEPKSDTQAGRASAPKTEEIEGISPVALKWMRRSGLSDTQLSSLYSLGIDEIDLVAESVPGKSKAERMHSAVLLLGISAYLSSGIARVSDDKLREACGHYNAYDVTNFSKHIKALSAEVSGTKDAGYSLTSRGITTATELIKGIVAKK